MKDIPKSELFKIGISEDKATVIVQIMLAEWPPRVKAVVPGESRFFEEVKNGGRGETGGIVRNMLESLHRASLFNNARGLRSDRVYMIGKTRAQAGREKMLARRESWRSRIQGSR